MVQLKNMQQFCKPGRLIHCMFFQKDLLKCNSYHMKGSYISSWRRTRSTFLSYQVNKISEKTKKSYFIYFILNETMTHTSLKIGVCANNHDCQESPPLETEYLKCFWQVEHSHCHNHLAQIEEKKEEMTKIYCIACTSQTKTRLANSVIQK